MSFEQATTGELWWSLLMLFTMGCIWWTLWMGASGTSPSISLYHLSEGGKEGAREVPQLLL